MKIVLEANAAIPDRIRRSPDAADAVMMLLGSLGESATLAGRFKRKAVRGCSDRYDDTKPLSWWTTQKPATHPKVADT